MKKRWNQLPVRSKLYAILLSMALLILGAIAMVGSIVVVFVEDMQQVLDANLSCYYFQESIAKETELFGEMIRKQNANTVENYRKACQRTKEILEQLPCDYELVGAERYALTRSIRNAYGQYELYRNNLVALDQSEQGYGEALYDVYNRQYYLQEYAARLTKMVLVEGNDAYAGKAGILQQIIWKSAAAVAAVLILLLILVTRMVNGFIKPIQQLAAASEAIERNDFSTPEVIWHGKDEIGQLVTAFHRMKRATQQYRVAEQANRQMREKLHQKQLEQAELKRQFSMAQLHLLKSQMNPHFLFNTMNMIARMAQWEEAVTTEEMLVRLSSLLRYTIRNNKAMVPLADELRIVEEYMYLQQMRFGQRIRFCVRCPDTLHGIEVPVFLLQPLVENALVHGVEPERNGGLICLRVELKPDQTLCISVSDTGRGMPPERLAQVRNALNQIAGETDLGIGLGNVAKRLASYYNGSIVRITSRPGMGTVVRIQIRLDKRKIHATEGKNGVSTVDCRGRVY